MKNASYIWRLGVLAAMLFCSFSAQANPISIPEKSITPEITFLICFSIFLEAVCVLLLLRYFRKPRFFVLWILGLHLITYPAFLGLLWLFQNMRPFFAVALGEGLIVIIEGTLIYLICRFVPPSKQIFLKTSLVRCWMASLVGNACSLVAFPLLINLYDFISHH
jgi:hypothetical protein